MVNVCMDVTDIWTDAAPLPVSTNELGVSHSGTTFKKLVSGRFTKAMTGIVFLILP